MADSASGSWGTSTSARKPSLPRFTPSTGNRCRSASRMARSMVPSPPMLTSRSARSRSSSADTGVALQATLDSSVSMPRTSIPRWSAQSSTEATAPPQSRSGCSTNPTTCMPSRYRGRPRARSGREQLHDPGRRVVPGRRVERGRARPEERVPDSGVADQLGLGARALITELQRDSEHVRDWWPRHDVSAIGSGAKKLRHPRLGPVEYSHVVLQVADHPDQTLVTYSPATPPAIPPQPWG